MNIKTKIWLLTAIPLFGMSLLIGLSLWTLLDNSQKTEGLIKNKILPIINKDIKALNVQQESIENLLLATQNLYEGRIAEKSALVATEEHEINLADKTLREKIKQAKNIFSKSRSGASKNLKVKYTELLSILSEWEEKSGQTIAFVRDPETVLKALEISEGPGTILFNKMQGLIQQIAGNQKSLIGKSLTRLQEVIHEGVVDAKNIVEISNRISLLFSIITAVALFIFLVFIFFVTRSITKPIANLQKSAIQLARGNLDHSIDVSRKDELGVLAKSFSDMRDSIRKQFSDLQVLNETAEVLAGLFDQTEALETVLRTLREKTHVESGSVYLLNDEGELEFKAYYPSQESQSTHQAKNFKLGEGIAGVAAKEKRIIHIPDTSKSAEFASPNQQQGSPRGLICIPLLDDQKVFGVMNFSGKVNQVIFNETDQEFAQTIARMTVVTTKNIQMLSEIEEYSHTLELKVQERTAAITDLLDNAGQGFLTFGPDYKISNEYSRPCRIFFDRPIEGLNALDLIFDDSGSVKELLDNIFKGVGDFNLFGDLLPSEITLQDMTIELDYRLIKSSQRDDVKVMMILTDVTKERNMAEQIETEEKSHNMIVKVALDKDGFLQFLREIENIYLSIYTLLANSPEGINSDELFRYFHTIKGGAASYGLVDVADKAHSIEEILEGIRDGKNTITNDMILNINDETLDLQNIQEDLLKELEEVIPEEDRDQSEKVYRITATKIARLRTFLKESVQKELVQHMQKEMEELVKQPIGPVLRKFASTATDLAGRLQKQIQVVLHGVDTEVSYDHLEGLFGALRHLIRNSIDHGLETTEERTMLGKTETGKLSLTVIEENQKLKIIISDDGPGIDPQRLKTIGLEKNIIDQDFANTASEEELIHLIFAPGFSTKEEVTDISGRGVGMDALKTEIDKLHGEVKVMTEIGQGTTFEITIPSQNGSSQQNSNKIFQFS